MVLKIQKNKCKWLVGSVSWTSAKPNFTNCSSFPPSNALDDLLFDEVSVKVILRPSTEAIQSISNGHLLVWTTSSVLIQSPPFIDSLDISRTHGWRGASGNKKFPGAMLPLFDQNLQTSCLNFLSRSSPSSLPEVIELHRNGAVLGGIPISTLVLVSNLWTLLQLQLHPNSHSSDPKLTC